MGACGFGPNGPPLETTFAEIEEFGHDMNPRLYSGWTSQPGKVVWVEHGANQENKCTGRTSRPGTRAGRGHIQPAMGVVLAAGEYPPAGDGSRPGTRAGRGHTQPAMGVVLDTLLPDV